LIAEFLQQHLCGRDIRAGERFNPQPRQLLHKRQKLKRTELIVAPQKPAMAFGDY
jgi:hypothetical protein